MRYDWLGDVIYTRTFGQSTIILQSSKAADDLLEKRSANYSDKLVTEMIKL